MTRIVILGGGTGGAIIANRLHRRYRTAIRDGRVRLTVVERRDRHVYQPGLLFVPFGMERMERLSRPVRALLPKRVELLPATIDHVDADANLVHLADGAPLPYDVLVVATGSHVVPKETEGLTGPGWRERIFDFYSPHGAKGLAAALPRFQGGRVVVNIVDMPIKCPVAPLEFTFLADWYFTRRGIRDKVSLTFVTPLDGAFTKPACTRALTHLLTDKHIELVTEFNTGSVDGAEGVLTAYDGRTVPFDMLVTIPLHAGADYVARSPGLGDDLGFVRTDPHTLQSERSPNIFALGDATNVPASKAGSVAHFEAEVLEENIGRFLAGRPLAPDFDGHANCFIETGFHKALLIDFNYEVEPLPGRFPFAFGPLSLLEETRLNHWGKRAFEWVYWHMLIPGRTIPAVPARMSMRGKRQVAPPAAAPAPAPASTAAPPAAAAAPANADTTSDEHAHIGSAT